MVYKKSYLYFLLEKKINLALIVVFFPSIIELKVPLNSPSPLVSLPVVIF